MAHIPDPSDYADFYDPELYAEQFNHIERDEDAAYENWRDQQDEMKAYPQVEMARERIEDEMDRRQAELLADMLVSNINITQLELILLAEKSGVEL